MDIIDQEDMPYEREKAYEAIRETISELDDCLTAMKVIEAQFAAGDGAFDFKKLREARDTLFDQTDSHWGCLTLGPRGYLDTITNYINNVENPYKGDDDEREASEDERFDQQRDAQFAS